MKRNYYKLSAVLLILLAFVSCKDDKDDDKPADSISGFYGILRGGSEVPPNSSTATGSVTASFNNTTKVLTATITYSGVTVTAGHIHKGEEGVAGPVVFPFNITASPISFTSEALTEAQEADLKANMYYINLHSSAFPGGEIRGQLYANNIVGFVADLKGTNEVPTNASPATGMSVGTYNKDTKILSLTTTYSGMVVTAGHIHNADAGVAGPVVFPFTTTASPIVFTSSALSSSQETEMMSGHFYVNLHSTLYPDGEIRGQLNKQ